MNKEKLTLALVAHDNMKSDLAEWVDWNRDTLMEYNLVCTGTTGRMVANMLAKRHGNSDEVLKNITLLKSGPLGGDQQLGSMIAAGMIYSLFFFWDPMQAQPHDVDVKALLRIATLYNVPTAVNRSTADLIVSSGLFKNGYKPVVKDYSNYIERTIKL